MEDNVFIRRCKVQNIIFTWYFKCAIRFGNVWIHIPDYSPSWIQASTRQLLIWEEMKDFGGFTASNNVSRVHQPVSGQTTELKPKVEAHRLNRNVSGLEHPERTRTWAGRTSNLHSESQPSAPLHKNIFPSVWKTAAPFYADDAPMYLDVWRFCSLILPEQRLTFYNQRWSPRLNELAGDTKEFYFHSSAL